MKLPLMQDEGHVTSHRQLAPSWPPKTAWAPSQSHHGCRSEPGTSKTASLELASSKLISIAPGITKAESCRAEADDLPL